jgi:hypothetical protein
LLGYWPAFASPLPARVTTAELCMERIEALTGRSLTDPVAVTELCVAVTTLTLLPPGP